tara:strand:- start:1554 stop:1739 length:186 start_codon:yes stop_codon:yes gene_type:complete
MANVASDMPAKHGDNPTNQEQNLYLRLWEWASTPPPLIKLSAKEKAVREQVLLELLVWSAH